MKEKQSVNKRLSTQEISRLTNVSTATVSRVLDGNSHVSDHTREKIFDVMWRTSCTPNVFVQSLKRDPAETVSIICPDTMNVYIAGVIFSVQRELSRYNHLSLLNCTGYELENKKKGMSLLLQKRVDGIVLVGSSFNKADVGDNKHIVEAVGQVPIIWTNGALNAPNIYSVYCDNQGTAYRTTKWLFSTGMNGERIIYPYNRGSYSNKCKINRFLTTMIESDQPVFENPIMFCPLDRVDQVLGKLVKNPEDLSEVGAVMTSGNNLAAKVLRYLRRRGSRVPDQIQVIGYSNSELDNYCVSELTSINNYVSELSGEVAKTLLKMLGGEIVKENKVLKARVTPRESTKELHNRIQDNTVQ